MPRATGEAAGIAPAAWPTAISSLIRFEPPAPDPPAEAAETRPDPDPAAAAADAGAGSRWSAAAYLLLALAAGLMAIGILAGLPG